jgi:hypothetical protein
MNDTQPGNRTFPLALLSCVLGVASLFFLIITGLPALILGYVSLRAINAADAGRGRGLAIVGMVLGLVGILLTIVCVVAVVLLRGHDKQNRQACQNNLRIIGAAVASYETANHHYPPGTIANAKIAKPDKRLSWMVAILPYLNANPQDESRSTPERSLFAKFDIDSAWDDPANRSAADTALRWYLCPAYPRDQRDDSPAPTDYIGLGGIGADSPEFALRDADRVLNAEVGFFGYDRKVTEDDIERGTDVTLMATETGRDNGGWAVGGRATVRGVDTKDQPYISRDRQFGGLHQGGGFFLYVGGEAVFMSDKMDAEPLEQLVRLRKER